MLHRPFFEKDPVVATKINEYTNQLYFDAQKEMFKDIDLSLFKENFDVQKAIDIITFTLRGYSEAQTSPEKRIKDYSKEHERHIREIDEYIMVLSIVFYKEDR